MSKKTLLIALVVFTAISAACFAYGDESPRVKLPDEDVILTPASIHQYGMLQKTNAAMSTFMSKNRSWQFRWNELTRNPHRAWGEGIQIRDYYSINLLNAPQAGKQFILDNTDVLNAKPENLRLLYSEIVDGKAYQKYIQQFNGVDVLHSYLDLRISPTGKVFMFGSDYHPDISLSTVPTFGPEAAKAFSQAGLDQAPSDENIKGGKLYVLPLKYPTHIEYHLVYNFHVTLSGEEVWDTYVDAHTGKILWRWNLVNNFSQKKSSPVKAATGIVSGRVTISIYPHSYLLGSATVPLKSAYINVGGKEYVTDADGRFSVDIGPLPNVAVLMRLSGPYSVARRSDTTTGAKNAYISTSGFPGQELNIHWDDANSAASERNAFYHITYVHDFMRTVDGSTKLSDIDKQIPGIVNINQECNANWNGQTLNFFKASAACGNTAELADVIYHEYGHAINTFLYNRLIGRGMRSGALNEATADITANMILDDPRIGVGFRKNAPEMGIIRNSDNTKKYPEDLVNEIHDDGMILTGAVWDMRKAIGLEKTTRLAHYAKYGAPDATSTGEAFADYFIEILIADDDDGNLANGTPHSLQIIPAFIKHGIPASGIYVTHTPLADQNSVTQPYPINGEIIIGSAIISDMLTIAEVRVVYSLDNWATSNVFYLNYNSTAKQFSGEFPPQKAGSIVRYYLEIQDNYGSVARNPLYAPRSDYLFLVGYESKVFYDCETADGWTVFSDATTGQWVREKPIGTYNSQLGTPPSVPWVQPNEDHTPGTGKDKCWVTGNAPISEGLGANDIDNGATELYTRKYDVSSYIDPVVRYYRWYSNDAGATPGTDYWVVRISSDGGTNWMDIENTKTSNASWSAMVFRLRDYIDLTDRFQLLFVASDEEPGSLVEAAVDDFEILDINASLDVERIAGLVNEFRLFQNFPNPFNPVTTIEYSIPARSDIRLSVYSPLGQEVSVLASGIQEPGRYRATFDAATLPSGLYTYVLKADDQRFVRKMLLLK